MILYDETNGDPEVLDFLLPFNLKPNVQTWRGSFNNNFAEWKNLLNSYCTGDYIYQIDADEMISEYIIKNVVTILEMNKGIDLIFVPRINTVNGLTDEHVKMWGWNISKSEEHISEKIIDTDSAEYIFLKNNGFIIEESEI